MLQLPPNGQAAHGVPGQNGVHCRSGTGVPTPDRRWVTGALAVAGVLFGIVVVLTGELLPNDPSLQGVGQQLWSQHSTLVCALIIFILSTAAPFVWLSRLLGTICNVVQFLVISLLLLDLVILSHGAGQSVYTAAFTALFGISLFLPKDTGTKVIFAFTVLLESVYLIVATQPACPRHDCAVLLLSFVAYGYAKGVDLFLDRVTNQ
jgi:hypothetical protein